MTTIIIIVNIRYVLKRAVRHIARADLTPAIDSFHRHAARDEVLCLPNTMERKNTTEILKISGGGGDECVRDRKAFQSAVEIKWPAAFGALFVCSVY